MKNLQKYMEATGEQMTLFSQVASRDHVNHTAPQESDLEKKMTVTSGLKCLEQFEKLNRFGLWAKRPLFSGSEHAYPVGVFKNLERAKKTAVTEFCFRAGKYDLIVSVSQLPDEVDNRLKDLYKMKSPYDRNGELPKTT